MEKQPYDIKQEETSYLTVGERARAARTSQEFRKLSEEDLAKIRTVCSPNCQNIVVVLGEKTLPCFSYCFAYNCEELSQQVSKALDEMPKRGRVFVATIRNEANLNVVIGQAFVYSFAFSTELRPYVKGERGSRNINFTTARGSEGIEYKKSGDRTFCHDTQHDAKQKPFRFTIEVSLLTKMPYVRVVERSHQETNDYFVRMGSTGGQTYRLDFFNQPLESPIVPDAKDGKWACAPILTLPRMPLARAAFGEVTFRRFLDLTSIPGFSRYPPTPPTKRKLL